MTGPFSRRTFLAGSAAAGVVASLPLTLARQIASAAPLAATDGVLLAVYLQGGNDALNTFGPFDSGAYRTARGDLAIDPAQARSAGNGLWFHPSLEYLHEQWQRGNLAMVPGIGEPDDDHSHFSAEATWQSGRLRSEDRSTGWLGRWLDSTQGLALGANLGVTLPLQLRSPGASIISVGSIGDVLLPTAPEQQWVNQSIRGHRGGGLSEMGNRFGNVLAETAAYSDAQQPLFAEGVTRSDDAFVASLQRAAHLLNLGLGFRVVSVELRGFDTHADQPMGHAELLTSLDSGLRAFFSSLTPALQGQTTALVFSEFGRRVQPNDSVGTDHGAGGTAMLLGSGVRGGVVGDYPSLTDLTDRGDLRVHTDYRDLYAAVLADWMDADPRDVLGSRRSALPVFARGPEGGGIHRFRDVDLSRYYAGPLTWAVSEGIVQGTSPSTFEPHRPMSRAEFATILWRANGAPNPRGVNQFTDVPNGTWFTSAVQWMVEQDIATGTSPRTFAPHRTVTRAECATFLWRLRGRPQRAFTSTFDDVASDRYYRDAVNWMWAENITTGTSPTTFSPNDPVDRAQAVTFVYRDRMRVEAQRSA